jgi:hypothetical protein
LDWRPTACVLCACNCGIEIQLDGRRFERIRGDKAHPSSQGYTCEKPLRLDHYQNGRYRLTHPLRRRPDGSFEQVDWDTAIREVAAGFAAVRDAHGSEAIFYYGRGGQGNHLGGSYSGAFMRTLGARYRSNALAQEKTGLFWVSDRMLGTMATGDLDHCEVALFVGKNPWQSHGIPRARPTLREIARDPAGTLERPGTSTCPPAWRPSRSEPARIPRAGEAVPVTRGVAATAPWRSWDVHTTPPAKGLVMPIPSISPSDRVTGQPAATRGDPRAVPPAAPGGDAAPRSRAEPAGPVTRPSPGRRRTASPRSSGR